MHSVDIEVCSCWFQSWLAFVESGVGASLNNWDMLAKPGRSQDSGSRSLEQTYSKHVL